MKRCSRALTWVILNAGFLLILILWLFYGQEWAGNLVKWTAWTMAICNTIGAASDDISSAMCLRGRSVPSWLSMLTDVAGVLLLAATAHWVLAALWMWQAATESTVWAKDKTRANHA
jgi:hypothetical protein